MQNNTFSSYMDGAPVSYQLWNNYLIKNQNYKKFIKPRQRSMLKITETITLLKKQVKQAMNELQPQVEKENDCVIMVTHVISNPDWINIPCAEKIPAFVVCQKIINGEGNNNSMRNGSVNNALDMCQNTEFFIQNICISFRKYNSHMNLSELKYDPNHIGYAKIMNLEKEIMFQYFAIFQHFYIKPLQFTITVPLKNTHLYYTPFQTTNFLKLTWKGKMNNHPMTKYQGYMLSANKPFTPKYPSNIFKCDDGSYIDEISVCDGTIDCMEGLDERQCFCDPVMDLLPWGCKYVCNETSQNCPCSAYYFPCLSSSNCIPYLKVCDGNVDCLNGEDEFCNNQIEREPKIVISGAQVDIFTCSQSNTSIPIFLLNDFIPDCPYSAEDEIEYYDLMINPFHTLVSCNDSEELSCIPGHSHCFHMNKLCVFEFQQNTKILKHCRNGAHLYNCTNIQCWAYFKCPLSYCVPYDLICNGEWDCPQGDDEISCESYSCPNLFKCKNQRKCLHFSKVCDDSEDCILGDDELWCIHDVLLVCPRECKCFAQSFLCNHLDTISQPHIWNSIKYLKCISCNLQHGSNLFPSFHSIIFLNIKAFSLDSICIYNDNYVHVIYSLKHLDISGNRIKQTKQLCFSPLEHVTTFHLQHNSISILEENSFYLLLNLKLLDLSHNKISILKGAIFNGLANIKTINLTFNLIMFVDSEIFRDVPPNTVHSFNLKVCCMQVSWTKCKVEKNSFSNCDDLLSNVTMKRLCFLVGSLILFLNMISFILDIRQTRMKNQRQNFCSAYLAFIDWCFGIHLVIIALADMHYKANYIGLEMSWRSSFVCKLASFFALVSMAVSPILLSIMMLTTYCVIKWPMTSKFKNKSFVKRCMEVSFYLGISFCIILISTMFSLLGNNNLLGICLPLYTPNVHLLPLLFSTLIIVIVQIFSLMTIVTLSIFSLYTLKNVEISSKTQTRNNNYRIVSQHLFIVIFTNICCWVPSSIVFILPLCGYQVPSYLPSWITIMVVSINPVLDPLIFTILTPEMVRNFVTFYNILLKKTFTYTRKSDI